MTPLKAAVVMLTLMAAGAICPLSSFAQVQYREGEYLLRPEEKDTGKTKFFYKASEAYLLGATALDVTSTVHVLDHPTVARKPDGTVLARYYGIETGWAGPLGRRDASTAVAANVLLNFGIYWATRRMYRRGGHWRTIAIMVNVLKGTDNLVCGVRNVHWNAGVDGRVRAATGYTGQITWSH